MLLSWYIEAIQNALQVYDSKVRISKVEILINLFDAADADKEVTVDAAWKWIERGRLPNTSRYFPYGEVNETGVYNYFRDRPPSTIKALQEAFRPYSSSEIEFNMKDPDLFCWKLLNQFQVLLGFRMSEAPQGQMIRLFTKATHDISDFLLGNESDDERLPDEIDGVLKTLVTDIIEPLKLGYGATYLYRNIQELYEKLESLVAMRSSEIDYLLSSYNVYHGEIAKCRDRITELYMEICEIKDPPENTYSTIPFPFEIESK